MCQRLKSDPQLMEGFRKHVEQMGGYESANWTQVAKFLKIQYNFTAKRPTELRYYYYSLFADKPEYTSLQLAEMLKMGIQNRFKSQDFLPILERNLDIKIPSHKYSNLMQRYLKKVLQLFLHMLPRLKKALALSCRSIKMKSIKLLFRVIDIQDDNDEEIIKVRKYALLLEQLYLCFCNNIEISRPYLFTKLHTIASRHDFEAMISYIQYVDKLRKIFLNQYIREEDMGKHPFLKRTIKENKQSALYIKLIAYVDWESKYKLYNQIQFEEQDDEPYKMQIKTNKQQQKRKDLQNEFIQKKPKTKKIFQRKDNHKDPKTIMFEGDEIDQLEAEEPIDSLIERRDQMQSLYEVAFKYEIKLQK